MIKANKGEWSEFYAFLKILDERRVFAADENLEIIPDKFFVFRKIFRSEKNQELKIFDIADREILILDSKGKLIKEFNDQNLSSKIVKIFDKIKSSDSTTFEIPEARELMDGLLCARVKADNNSKADIEAEIFDRISDSIAPLGFSIKSIVGGASTLLNAGKTTNFIFRVENLDHNSLNEINSISTKSKVQDRIKAIVNKGGRLILKKVSKPEFGSNLKKIDSLLPIFVAQMLIDFFSAKASKVSDLVDLLSKNKLLEEYGLTHSDYKFKMQNLLHSAALGMVPSEIWDGSTKAHGGYIVVRNDGVIVCYHLYNRDKFLSYLYDNTKFESASTKRHEYGSLYLENGEMLFNLNLQIRFLK